MENRRCFKITTKFTFYHTAPRYLILRSCGQFSVYHIVVRKAQEPGEKLNYGFIAFSLNSATMQFSIVKSKIEMESFFLNSVMCLCL